MSDLILSEAPADYGPGRRCAKCKAKVSRYTSPHWGGALLCHPCERKRIDQDLEVHQFVPSATKRGRAGSYPLPNLRKIRKEKGLRQSDLAKEVECGTDHIKHIEHNGRLASCNLAGKMARALGVDVRALRGKW